MSFGHPFLSLSLFSIQYIFLGRLPCRTLSTSLLPGVSILLTCTYHFNRNILMFFVQQLFQSYLISNHFTSCLYLLVFSITVRKRFISMACYLLRCLLLVVILFPGHMSKLAVLLIFLRMLSAHSSVQLVDKTGSPCSFCS